MAALTAAVPPTAKVTEIPGRYSPVYVADKRNVGTAPATSTATNSPMAFLPRTETADANFSVPTTPVTELGSNYNVGEFDDLPESKLKLTSYDVSGNILTLLCGKNYPLNTTTTVGFQDLATAVVDSVRQFADPNGNVFGSMYMGDMVIDEFSASLKAKSAAMEDYSLSGFNMMLFRGFIQAKSYVVLAADVTAGYISITPLLGANEGVVPIPVPSAGQPASYWIQTGRLNFLKIDRYRNGQGWKRFPEVTAAPTSGYAQFTSRYRPSHVCSRRSRCRRRVLSVLLHVRFVDCQLHDDSANDARYERSSGYRNTSYAVHDLGQFGLAWSVSRHQNVAQTRTC